MRKKLAIIAILATLVFTHSVSADGKKYPGTKKDLVGHWSSKSIDGDALFLIISSLEGRMLADDSYVGTVNFTDFQSSSMKGKYDVDGDHLLLYTKERKKPYKLKFWFNDKDKKSISVMDENFGVTLTLHKRKKGAKSASGDLLDDL